MEDPVDGALGAGMLEDATVKEGRVIVLVVGFAGDDVTDQGGAVARVLDVFHADDLVVGELEWERRDVADGVHATGRDVRARSAESRVHLDPTHASFGGVQSGERHGRGRADAHDD